jgi:hypothetical protein
MKFFDASAKETRGSEFVFSEKSFLAIGWLNLSEKKGPNSTHLFLASSLLYVKEAHTTGRPQRSKTLTGAV